MNKDSTNQNPKKNKSASMGDSRVLDIASSILDTTSDGVIATNLKGEITFWNNGSVKMYKYSKEEILGKHVTLLYKPENEISALDRIKRVLAGERFLNDEVKVLDKSGNTLTVLMSLNGIKDENGEISQIVGITKDITEQKIAQQAIKESEQRFLQAFNNSPIPVSILNLKTGKRLAVNNTFCKNFGYTKEELLNEENFKKNNIAADQKEFRSIVKKLRSKETIFEQPFSMFTRSGDVRQVLLNATKVYDHNDDIYITSYLDITERKQIENALISSEKKFRNLANTAQVAIAILREPPDNNFVYVNQYWEKLTGYSSEEAKKLTPMDLVEPEFHKVLTKDTNKRSSRGMASDRNEFKIITKSGESKWVNFTATTIEFDGEKAVLRTGLDITERKNSELRYRSLFESARDAILIIDFDKIIDVNQSTLKKFGYKDKSQIVNNSVVDISPKTQPDGKPSRNEAIKVIKKALTGEPQLFNWKHKRKDDTEFHTQVSLNQFSYNNNKFILASVRDISERVAMEEDLSRAKENAEKSENYLESILNNIGDPVFVKDERSKIILVNDSFCNLFELSRENIIVKTLAEDVSQEEMEIFLKIDKQVLETGKENINEESLTVRGGKSKTILTRKTRYIDNYGKKHLIGVISDITDLKNAEIELKKAQEIAHIGNWYLDIITGEITWSDELYKMYGFDPALPVPPLSEHKKVLTPESWELLNSSIENAINTGNSYAIELKTNKRKGNNQWDWIFAQGEPIMDSENNVIALRGTAQNITDRKLAEENTKEALMQLNLAVETAKIGVWSHDIETDELVWNSELFEIFGTSPSEFDYSFEAFKKMIHPEDLEYVLEQQGKVLENKSVTDLKYRIIRPNKEVRYVYASITPIFDKEKNLIKITGINLDVTEDRKSKEKLAKANAELIDAVSSLNELKKQLEDQNIYLKKELDLVFNFQEMVYGSALFSQVLTDLERVAPTDATVLILGESGTGKELLARALHNLSLRKDKPLIKVNCSAIPTELIESELFGHKKGSFTGAVSDKVGKFELADGGTLFLDEIGDLPVAMQPKLLRFLQEGEMEVVGGTTTKSLDVRIVAATNKNLKEEVNKEQFREDLYFRLNVFPIEVPPLRDRKEDIPLLVEHFTDKFGKKYRKNIKYISDAAMQDMRNYNWPGNIRELENLIERSVILSDTETLGIQGFTSKNGKNKRSISNVDLTLDEIQRNHMLSVLNKTNWKVDGKDGAAKILDLKPSTFRDKMKKLGIKRTKK